MPNIALGYCERTIEYEQMGKWWFSVT